MPAPVVAVAAPSAVRYGAAPGIVHPLIKSVKASRGFALDRSREAVRVTEPLLGELSRLGLTSDEARCYLALVGSGGLTAGQLCSAAGVTRGRIYDVVRGLLSKGLALETATTVRRFEPVPPPVAVANLLERRRRENEELERSARQVIESLEASAATGEAPPPLLEVIRHRASLRERCGQLERAATENILFFVQDHGQVAGDLVEELAALRRGVRLRALYESSLLHTPYLETMQRFLAGGGEGRHVPELPTRLTVIDERVTMIPLHQATPAAREFTVLVIHHAGLSTLATSAFEHTWADASPVPFPTGVVTAAGSPDGSPSGSINGPGPAVVTDPA